jgi:hypothetical protein
MRIHQSLCAYALTSCCILAASTRADAAEYAFATYGLGESAFSAGVTPPPGTYVSVVTGYFSGDIKGAVSFGSLTLNAGFRGDILSTALNLLYVPDRKLLGGNLGLSITVPSAWVDYRAGIEVLSQGFSREVSGWGVRNPEGSAWMATRRLLPHRLPGGHYPNGLLGTGVEAHRRFLPPRY